MKRLIRFFREGEAEEWMGIGLIVLVIVPVICNIFNRAVLQQYSTTLEAIALSSYVWIGYASFGYLYKKNANVDVKFIRNCLPPLGQAILDVVRDIFIFVFSVFITYWGVKLCISGLARNITGTTISYFIPYLSIVVGFGSGAIRSFWSLIGPVCKIAFRKLQEWRYTS